MASNSVDAEDDLRHGELETGEGGVTREGGGGGDGVSIGGV